jgi:hypothetical protein
MNCERDSVQKGKQHQSIFVKPKEMNDQLYITTTLPPPPEEIYFGESRNGVERTLVKSLKVSHRGRVSQFDRMGFLSWESLS